MAFDAFLKLDGVEGEGTRKGFEKQIPLESFSWGAHNPTSPVGAGAGAGRVEISNFTVTKKTDRSSAKLFQSCCTGKHFPTAMLTVLKASGANSGLAYLKYEFKELFVTDINWSGATGGDDTRTEHAGFAFSSVEVTYTPQKPDGSPDAAIVVRYNRKTGDAA